MSALESLIKAKKRHIKSFTEKITQIEDLVTEPTTETVTLKSAIAQIESRWDGLEKAI